MTKAARRVAGMTVVVAVLGWASGATGAESGAAVAVQTSLMAPDARVRGVSARVVALINDATAQSKTFHELIDRIGTTDGIVYVAEGQCGHGVRACLLLTNPESLISNHREVFMSVLVWAEEAIAPFSMLGFKAFYPIDKRVIPHVDSRFDTLAETGEDCSQ